jgi:microsomal dipeptidase-like Zn-dependent dipeptidase
VGLWPYRHRGRGMADVHALVDHARHVASLVGPGHLCLGTDMNGVPGVMGGYRDERDLPVVTDALLANGFSEGDVRGILGGNVARVLAEVTGDRW